MSARIKGLVVTFESDMHPDDVAPLMVAIGQLRGVASVDASEANVSDIINRRMVAHGIKARVWAALLDETKES